MEALVIHTGKMADNITNYDYDEKEMSLDKQEQNSDSTNMFDTTAPKDWRQEEKEEQKSNTELTIHDVTLTRVRTTDQDGKEIAPNESKDGKTKWYQAKLKVVFEEKTKSGLTLVEYYPHVKYFIRRDGSMSEKPRLPRQPEVVVGKMFQLYLEKTGNESNQVSDADFIEWLKGKKVRVVPNKERGSFRNDIIDAYEPQE